MRSMIRIYPKLKIMSSILVVKVRADLMSNSYSSIWLEVGLPRHKKFLVGQTYREWQLPNQKDKAYLYALVHILPNGQIRHFIREITNREETRIYPQVRDGGSSVPWTGYSGSSFSVMEVLGTFWFQIYSCHDHPSSFQLCFVILEYREGVVNDASLGFVFKFLPHHIFKRVSWICVRTA